MPTRFVELLQQRLRPTVISTKAPAGGALQATAYDDRVRASVGEVVVETDRDEVREGRLCLVAGGPAAFPSLQVRGLDL